jgi:hypothetical protein
MQYSAVLLREGDEMDAKTLMAIRKQAEEAVADMPDGTLKLKAFEIILSNLLTGPQPESAEAAEGRQDQAPRRRGKRRAKVATNSSADQRTNSAAGRILVLKDETFFGNQRSISEVKEELSAHGWHYPLTSLSGTLQNLVTRRELRRVRSVEGTRRVWKYSNY